MKAGKYSVQDLFVNRYVDQVIIPEIQRDYVWQPDQVEGLLGSILSDYEQYSTATVELSCGNPELEQAFSEFVIKRKYASNIGFIYAYHDQQSDGKYFLIDGQQRLTTIFLLLLNLACRDTELQEKFSKNYFHNGIPKIDYRIRESSHDFLYKFVDFLIGGNLITELEKQRWLYSRYSTDATTTSLINNYGFIEDYITERGTDPIKLYTYILELVEFWYFDTNVSEQGEELYIYMNARGEQVQSNENIKAEMLGRLASTAQKNEYGKTWEDWQDFFWIKKGDNPNADAGFNEFLSCIAGLENYLITQDKTPFYTPDDFDRNGGLKVGHIIDILELRTIEKYYSFLEFIHSNTAKFSGKYRYSGWIKNATDLLWSILNDTVKTNWFADFGDANRGREQNRMVYLWSMFYFFAKHTENSEPDIDKVFRVLRLYYVRYHNYDRSVSGIKATVDNLLANGLWQSKANTEESKKHAYLEGLPEDDLLKCECEIWHIEDHKLNLEGRDVGNINISHLIDLNSSVSLDDLILVREKFYEIFPKRRKDRNDPLVQSLLLHFGEYWQRVSPYYYENYKCDDWPKIIRNLPLGPNKIFSAFFSEFLLYKGSLEKFLEKKQKQNITVAKCNSLRDMLLFYNQYLGIEMWRQGSYIVRSQGQECSLKDWRGKDAIFGTSNILYNTKGNLNGGDPQVLFKLLPKDIRTANKKQH